MFRKTSGCSGMPLVHSMLRLGERMLRAVKIIRKISIAGSPAEIESFRHIARIEHASDARRARRAGSAEG